MPDWLADPLGYGIVIFIITYLSVVVGELVPKQIALRNPERYRAEMGGFLNSLGR